MSIPASRQPVLDSNALFSRPWYLFFQRLTNSDADPSTVTVGASPFTYTASSDGLLIITGGTVSLIEYGRNSIYTATGLTAGVVPVVEGDSVRITYTVLPTVTWVRK